MNKLRICIIGAGNISNTRHIPAILKNKELEIMGIVSDDKNKIERTKSKYKFINKSLLIDSSKDIVEQLKNCKWFMEDVEAVIIGVPPKQHYEMTRAALLLKKHTLIEKPFMMSEQECLDVIEISRENKLVLNVMHTFQFSDGMIEMDRRLKSGEFGRIQSILEIQLTNRKRRLPVWYNDLPLGLYYDEAAHFFYSARRFGGELKVLNANAQFNKNQENTPRFIQAQLKAGDIPVQMYMNFNSPICEWAILLICEEKIAIYDFFKDILIVLSNDNLHLAKDVLKTSLSFSLKFWIGFIKNGFKMINHSLLYGHDKCINTFAKSIRTKEVSFEISPELGLEVVKAMNEVVNNVKGEK